MEHVSISKPKKFAYVLVVLEIGAIVILAILIYNTLFPKAYWRSRELERDRAVLEQNWAKWNRQHITHYRMSLALLGYGYDFDRMPLTVEVKDGKAVSVVDVRGETVSPEDAENMEKNYQHAFTIPGLFSYGYQTFLEKPPGIQVYYDPALGYPTSIYVDPYTEPCCQDFTYTVRDLQVLPP
jgi:hypothetical protein